MPRWWRGSFASTIGYDPERALSISAPAPGAAPMPWTARTCDDRLVPSTSYVPAGGPAPEPGGPTAGPSGARAAGQSSEPDLSPAPEASRHRVRRLRQDRLIAGVATGLAEHLGVSLLSVRVAFVGLTALAGFGAVLYAALWVVTPIQPDGVPLAPGLAAAQRSGLRTSTRRLRMGDAGQLAAFAALGLGLLLLVQAAGLGVDPVLFWPALLVGGGLLLIWRQGDEAEPVLRAAPSVGGTGSDTPSGVRGFVHDRGWRGAVRVVAGGVLVLVGLTTFVVTSGRLDVATDVFLGVLVAVVGVALVAGPWLLRTFRALSFEREERILSQERADVAAHLHDSVLQTLALIQRQAQDPREVVRLARSQERDLRGWLYGSAQPPDASLRAALERVAAEVEEQHGVPVEVVVVGDSPVDEHLQAMTRAAREALVNAAKHAGTDRVDLFAEVEDRAIVAYVRDRGVGFDPAAVDERRLGLRHSIVERMARHGGTATVRSAPGEGTEVRLDMARSDR